MNILVLSAGRRTSLVTLFKGALLPLGGSVVAADIDGLAPAALIADSAFCVPRVQDPAYKEAILDLVSTNRISAVIPTIDTELAPLEGMKVALGELGCVAVVGDSELLRVAADKLITAASFGDAGFRVPRWWHEGEADQAVEAGCELFIKPRFGSSSADAYAVDPGQLISTMTQVDRPIIQERIRAPEVTVDAFLDFDGRPIHYVPRRRLKTVGGESVQGVTIDDEESGDWLRSVMEHLSALGGIGPVTIQYFDDDDGPILLEVNARFGGGFPLGHAAGAVYPEWIVTLLRGEKVEPSLGSYERGLYMTRTLTEQFVSSPLW